VHLRLALYQRIAGADATALQDMTAELIDRFGALPEPASHLLRWRACDCARASSGLRRLDLGPAGGSIQFEEHNRVDPGASSAADPAPGAEFGSKAR
jgi:transcription-repair coupling factor (superfamily II helicase)